MSASQTIMNPIQREVDMESWKTVTPKVKITIGVMYCSNPNIESGSRVAAAPNASSGIAVIGPSNSSIRLIAVPPSTNAAASELSRVTK